jgi:hypothetical protein
LKISIAQSTTHTHHARANRWAGICDAVASKRAEDGLFGRCLAAVWVKECNNIFNTACVNTPRLTSGQCQTLVVPQLQSHLQPCIFSSALLTSAAAADAMDLDTQTTKDVSEQMVRSNSFFMLPTAMLITQMQLP